MPEFKVIWEIDLEADTPRRAAQQAREIQLEPGNEATFFTVIDKFCEKIYIDLNSYPGGGR